MQASILTSSGANVVAVLIICGPHSGRRVLKLVLQVDGRVIGLFARKIHCDLPTHIVETDHKTKQYFLSMNDLPR